MNKIYLITGPAGVGKSTVSRLVAEKLEKSALIEGDDIYNLVVGSRVSPWKEGNHLPLFWKNCFDLIKNCLDFGYDIVFNYIIYNETLENIKKQFPGTTIKFIVLMVDEETIVKRDKLRPEDCRMGNRSLVLLKEFQKEFKNNKYVLNTSNLSAEETAEMILQ